MYNRKEIKLTIILCLLVWGDPYDKGFKTSDGGDTEINILTRKVLCFVIQWYPKERFYSTSKGVSPTTKTVIRISFLLLSRFPYL